MDQMKVNQKATGNVTVVARIRPELPHEEGKKCFDLDKKNDRKLTINMANDTQG